jgi:stage II sporulation protein AA (anti-sigma F factor antagonist)
MQALMAKYETCDDTLTITLSGEIDHHTAKAARVEIDRQIYFYKASTVILDLSEIAFMDSSGLGLILGRYTHIREMGSVLKVLNPTKSVKRLLTLAGTEKIIPIISTNGKQD